MRKKTAQGSKYNIMFTYVKRAVTYFSAVTSWISATHKYAQTHKHRNRKEPCCVAPHLKKKCFVKKHKLFLFSSHRDILFFFNLLQINIQTDSVTFFP